MTLWSVLALAVGCADSFNPSVIISPDVPLNEAPQIEATQPDADLAISQGDSFVVRWTDRDSDNDAQISIDMIQTDGSLEFPVASGIRENDSNGEDVFVVDTTNLVIGSFFVRLTIDDEVNSPVRSFAEDENNGNRIVVTITQEGLGQSNKAPRVFLSDPQVNVGVSQSDMLTISIRPTPDPVPALDPGPGSHYDQDGNDVNVTIVLDLDENPNNDDVLNEDDPGIIILDRAFIGGGRFDAVDFNIVIDVQDIPVRADGLPYFVRATATDGLNTVHSYATGTLHVLELVQGSAGQASRITDLGQVGRRFAGNTWTGFNPLSELGSKSGTAMDLDNDGADDFVIIAQYGNPRNRGNIGEAYIIFGETGRRFGGTININSVGADAPTTSFNRVRGALMHPHVDLIDNGIIDPGDDRRIGFASLDQPYTLGITDFVAVDHLGGAIGTCTSPELLFGLPHNEYMGTTRDDDPGNDPQNDTPIDPYCYQDNMPNNYASDEGDDPTEEVMYVESGVFSGNGWSVEERLGTAAMMYGENCITALGAGANQCVNMFGPPPEPFSMSSCGARSPGVRFNVAIYDYYGFANQGQGAPFPINPLNAHYGFNVGTLEDVDLNGATEVVISAPRNELETAQLQAEFGESHPHLASRLSRANVTVFLGQDFQSMRFKPNNDPTTHIPYISIRGTPIPTCGNNPFRRLETEFVAGGGGAIVGNLVSIRPGWFLIRGEKPTDKLGGATSAGDFNLDGPADILCGAPFSDPELDTDQNGFPDEIVANAGTAYVVYSRLPFGNVNLSDANNISDIPPTEGGISTRPPMLRIFGESAGDHLGLRQEGAADMNSDGIGDVVIASRHYNGQGLVDNGFVGIVYGGQRIDGDRVVLDIGSPRLEGTRFYGSSSGDLAGADIAAGGDFNGDGMGDLLIAAPGELRSIAGEDKPRRGMVYLIFGGLHLVNEVFNLSQVGTAALPGVAFAGPYQQGTPDAYELDQPVFVQDSDCRPLSSDGTLVDSECLCDPEIEEGCVLLQRDANDPEAPGSIALFRMDDAAPEAVDFIGDINGDGFDDIIIGNPTADLFDQTVPAEARRRDVGEAYLIYGNNFGENTLSNF
jgi:hypothetical protein